MKRPLFLTLLALSFMRWGPMETLGARAESPPEADSSSKSLESVKSYYTEWKRRYLKPSLLVPGDCKIAFTSSGNTVSEAMGYGMLITVMMADCDPLARQSFDGLNRFRKRYPSSINPDFMAWKIPSNEKKGRNDSATDGDMDMAMALLMANRTWGDAQYLREAKTMIQALEKSLIRQDGSLRLGDWDTDDSKAEMIRTSDLVPINFRAFYEATGDERWKKVEDQVYDILGQLQRNNAQKTGLIPDFAVLKEGRWQPAKPNALEGPHDGEYSYNACRVPWRIGWGALTQRDDRALRILRPLMAWAKAAIPHAEDFKAGYHLDGKMIRGSNYDSPCFIAPTGVAALALGDKTWSDAVISYGLKAHEGYYEDSVNLLSLLVMSGKAAIPQLN